MIPLPGVRDKGSGPLLGAKGPHQSGPFGTWPDPDEPDDQDHDDLSNATPDALPHT